MSRPARILMREAIGSWSAFGGELASIERAVHAVAQLELLLERLDVNVRRLLLERLDEDQIHDLDDRRVLAFHRQPIEVDLLALLLHLLDLGRFLRGVLAAPDPSASWRCRRR